MRNGMYKHVDENKCKCKGNCEDGFEDWCEDQGRDES